MTNAKSMSQFETLMLDKLDQLIERLNSYQFLSLEKWLTLSKLPLTT